METLHLEAVRKSYPGGIEAVGGVDLAVAPGERVALVGPSGCGKTTLLRLIAGLETLASGSIRLGATALDTKPPHARGVAMVFQEPALYPHLSVFGNLAFGLRLRGLGRQEIRRRVEETAALLDIAALLSRAPETLSGGQRQRVAIGRALVRQAPLLLFDEPLSSLDAQLRADLRGELLRLHARLGATTLYVTHDQLEALTLGARVAVMREGLIEQVDTPEALYAHPANRFVAGFIGTPATNFVAGRIETAGGASVFRARGLELALPENAPAGAVILGVRPRALTPEPPERAPWRGVVEMVEMHGEEALVHVACGGETIRLTVPTAQKPAAGAAVGLRPDPAACHLFDVASGINLQAAARA